MIIIFVIDDQVSKIDRRAAGRLIKADVVIRLVLLLPDHRPAIIDLRVQFVVVIWRTDLLGLTAGVDVIEVDLAVLPIITLPNHLALVVQAQVAGE